MISSNPASSTRNKLWSALADVITVLIFVAIGRRNHDGTVDPEGVFEVAAPFLMALAATWIFVLVRRWQPLHLTTGVVMWIVTLTFGMILRKVLFDGGTATAFVIVATIFLGVGLNGWRAISRLMIARRSQPIT